ncbi:MAG TPA: cellulose synthase operon protein YhjQ/BcsQ [Acidimicrobiales bacterium]|jgi:CO dehydrogenase maturation factor|nr:cellulose synthase operon protein YhjQ/BcsQ [Acidimicrobiales bacterium]
MRIAFVGKGGVGKSAIAGTFARALARRGEPVLAIDSDPLPGLAFSLGLELSDAPLPDEAIEERAEGEDGHRWRLARGLSAAEAVERYAAVAPDGVRFLQFGKHRGDTRALFRSQFAFRQILRELPEDRWKVVGDLPGGTRQAFSGWGDYARTVLVVVEPSAKSLLTARRLSRLALDRDHPRRIVAVANKVREDGDVDLISRRTGLDVVGAIPWDEALAEAEQKMAAPIDMAPDSAAVQAVESLVDQMSEERIG